MILDPVDATLRARIPEIVDLAMEEASTRDWLLPGCRDKAIELATRQVSWGALIDTLSQVLREHRVAWHGDDPHDGWGRS